jgi:hypothetical protein
MSRDMRGGTDDVFPTSLMTTMTIIHALLRDIKLLLEVACIANGHSGYTSVSVPGCTDL